MYPPATKNTHFTCGVKALNRLPFQTVHEIFQP